MRMKEKFSCDEWNVGFVEEAPSEALDMKTDKLTVTWLKHDVRDSCFADPFIHKVSDERVELLAEQMFYKKPDARLSKLTVDRRTHTLIDIRPVLELPSHLSYPFIARAGGETFVMPENIASGKLSLYRFDGEAMVFDRVVADAPLADATIVDHHGKYYLFAGKKGSENSELYMWESTEPFGGYNPADGIPVKSGSKGSRMAGAFVRESGRLYRVAQDCEGGYGLGVMVYEVEEMSTGRYSEKFVKQFRPDDNYYDAGVHTLNFHHGVGVVDGYRFRFDPFAKLIRKWKGISKGFSTTH